MDKNYIGDVGLGLIVDCGRDISGASNTKLVVRRPDGSTVEWAATVHAVDGRTNHLWCVTQPGDLNMAGQYRLQAAFTLGDWSGRGKTAAFTINRPFE